MSIRRHLLISIVGEVGGFVLGALAVIGLRRGGIFEGFGSWFLLPLAVFSFGFLFLARTFLNRIPARCPECGGPAFQQGRKPISYHCSECRRLQAMRFSTNV